MIAVAVTKACLECGEEKPLEEFLKLTRGGHVARCRSCYRQRNKEAVMRWREKNIDRVRLQERRKALKRLYGITPEDYLAMLEAQGGVCAICKRPERLDRSLAVDHCHTTDVVRGLLCATCNVAIGALDHSEDLLGAAILYLRGF